MTTPNVRRSVARGRDYVYGRFFPSALILILFGIAPGVAHASTYRWQVDADGNWNNAANWELVEGPAGAGYPNFPGDVAVLDDALITGDRQITIPDLVAVSIGRLVVENDSPTVGFTIIRAGTGLLVFDNAGEDATIEAAGGGQSFSTPIHLNAHLVITGTASFLGGISEMGGSRNLTLTAGSVTMGSPANTYTGDTTILNGSLIVNAADPAAIRIPGPLIVGDGGTGNGPAIVSLPRGAIASSSDVLVHQDGTVNFNGIGVGPTVNEINDLTLDHGVVAMNGTLVQLQVANANMIGGTIQMSGASTRFILVGTLAVASTATATPQIPNADIFNDEVALTAASQPFLVANGPQAIDLRIDAPIVGAGFGLDKRGPGIAVFNGANTYTGTTTITAGTLLLNGTQQGSPVSVAGGTLGGGGSIGSVTATSGAVSPGDPSATAVLTTGSVTLAGGVQFVVDINGTTAGSGHDQLAVTGTVNLGGATLAVNTPPAVAAGPAVVIVNNDSNDPIAGEFASLPEGTVFTTTSGLQFAISYVGGDGNDVTLANVTPVTYFLSEGATGTFFDEDVLIANPNGVGAPVRLTFFLPGGGTVEQERMVPAQSRLTVTVDEIEGLEATSPSVQVLSIDRMPLGVERTMFWDGTHYAGHTANAVPQAERQWYFAEGAQGSFFNTYLLLGNASASPIEVTVTYLREDDTPVTSTVNLPAFSRETVYAGDNPALVDKSFGIIAEAAQPFTAERAMYFATTPAMLWAGGHVNVGSAAPSTSWFHAEGASGTFFTTFILMSNPQDTPANVTLRFLLQQAGGGGPIEITRTIPAKQRLTLNPAALGLAELENAAFSTIVTSDVPIVSERVMYWPKGTLAFGEGHASSGVVQTANHWVLAEGRVGGPEAYTTYVLLANPSDTASTVEVTFLRESGAPVVQTYNVPANTRFNIDVGGMVPDLQNESFGVRIDVTAGSPIAVERSMYWNANGIFWSGGTNALAEIRPEP